MNFTHAQPNFQDISVDISVVFVFADRQSHSLEALTAENPSLVEQLTEAELISSKTQHMLPLIGQDALAAKHLLVVGCGHVGDFNEAEMVTIIKRTTQELVRLGVSSVALVIDDLLVAGRDVSWTAAKVTERILTTLYRYDTTKSQKAEATTLVDACLLSSSNLHDAIASGQAIATGINFCRELGNLPANICDPQYLADQALALAKDSPNVAVEILDETALAELGMGAYAAVCRGSNKDGKMILVNYKGAESDAAPHVLVGKGLTFDSGGYSLKSPSAMEDMKWDMLGAATVLGVLTSIAQLQPAINVIGVIAAAENMVSGGATRPGDVVTCLNGKTVEIINTDAEGRLVLCDALSYVERLNPASVVDIATLTGAIIVGLGHHAAAVYANDEELSEQLLAAGQTAWDRGWPMPLWPEYKPYLKSSYADLRNVGPRAGGSITAAMYLSEFAAGYPWAHLDIAGVGWESAKEGATGRPVAMLIQYLLNRAAASE